MFILILNGLFTNAINLASYLLLGEQLLDDWRAVVLSGMIVFALQALLIIRLVKPFLAQLLPTDIFKLQLFIRALFTGLIIWVLTQVWIRYTTGSEITFPEQKRVTVYFLIFVFNSIPAAFLEEILFRHLPLRYGESKHFSPQQITILAVAIGLIFSISHVSAYLFRDHIPFTELSSPLIAAFFYGLAYFLVYAVTRNIYLVTLIHAFSNNPLYLVDSPQRETFYFYTYIFVIILWLILREMRKRIAWRNERKS